MKPWVIWVAAAVGVLLGLGVVSYQHRRAQAEVAAPPASQRVGVMWGGTVGVLVDAEIAVAPGDDDLARIAHEEPQLTLVDSDGAQLHVRAYKVTQGRLVLTSVPGLRPDRYRRLIATYSPDEQTQVDIEVDLRTRGLQ